MSNQIPPPPPMPLNTNSVSSCYINTSERRKCPLTDFDHESPLVRKNFYSKYSVVDLKPTLQTGPNCGLAALAMAATITPYSICLQDLFEKAKSYGFTNKGEMFSVRNMATLADATLSPCFKVEMFSGGLDCHQDVVFMSLKKGDLFLVPYDADKNNSPCCKKGHKAHWAVLCGLLKGEDGCMYVAARHGKSRHLATWLFQDLQASNSNLHELHPDRSENEYIIPNRGVDEGLAGKFILLSR